MAPTMGTKRGKSGNGVKLGEARGRKHDNSFPDLNLWIELSKRLPSRIASKPDVLYIRDVHVVPGGAGKW